MGIDIDPLEILTKSMCGTCAHRFSRLIEPISDEYREYLIEEFDIDDDDILDILIEQHRCMIVNEDLEGIVHECNRYLSSPEFNLIREYKF